MEIPKVVLEGFWQTSVQTAEIFFRSLPKEEPLLHRKILETVFARFSYEATIDIIKQAGSDPLQWERQLSNELDIFRTLLLGLIDSQFDMAFKVLEGGNVDAIA